MKSIIEVAFKIWVTRINLHSTKPSHLPLRLSKVTTESEWKMSRGAEVSFVGYEFDLQSEVIEGQDVTK